MQLLLHVLVPANLGKRTPQGLEYLTSDKSLILPEKRAYRKVAF
jgi:hypothetical protein